MRPSLLSAVALTIVALYAMPAAAQVLDDEASVEFEDQTMQDSTVTVANVTLPEGGFVVIHDDSLQDGGVMDDQNGNNSAVDSVVGFSEYLEPGTHEDVEVNVTITGTGTGGSQNQSQEITLIAMLHMDTNNNEEFDFEDSDGEDDGAYTETVGGAVTDEARVTMEGGTGGGGTGGDGLDDPGDGNGFGDDGEDDDVVDGDEDTPGFGAVALLALLGAVAALRRR